MVGSGIVLLNSFLEVPTSKEVEGDRSIQKKHLSPLGGSINFRQIQQETDAHIMSTCPLLLLSCWILQWILEKLFRVFCRQGLLAHEETALARTSKDRRTFRRQDIVVKCNALP